MVKKQVKQQSFIGPFVVVIFIVTLLLIVVLNMKTVQMINDSPPGTVDTYFIEE